MKLKNAQILKELSQKILNYDVDLDKDCIIVDSIDDNGLVQYDHYIPIADAEYHIFSARLLAMVDTLNILLDMNDVVFSNALKREIADISVAIKSSFKKTNKVGNE